MEYLIILVVLLVSVLCWLFWPAPGAASRLHDSIFVTPPGKVLGLKPPLAGRHPPPKFWDGTVWRVAP